MRANIVSVCETHLSGVMGLDLKDLGYEWYGFNRTHIHKDAPKASGGVGFLIRTDIMRQYEVNIMDKCIDGILGIQFNDKFTDFKFIAFVCYLPPENSPWGRDALAFFSHLLSQIYLNSETDAIFLLGDINSRLGSLRDFCVDIDNIRSRDITDHTQNIHGQSFSEFLLDS